MSGDFILQMEPWFGEEEKLALVEYMDEGGFITEYKRTEQFERMIAEFTGAKHCIVVNNGTVSLTLAALALGIGPGDEVIVPNYTMIATPNSVKMIGANPVFVDVEPETLCLEARLVEKALTKRTKAVMLVAANGRYPRAGIESHKMICEKHGLALIEDAAQALGSYYPDGKHIGRHGAVGSFSFSSPKIISTGQGGCLITDDDALAQRLRRLKDFGRAGGGTDVHTSIGYNFKFTDLQACIGVAQMKKLPDRIRRKKEIAKCYEKGLSDCREKIRMFAHDYKHTVPWFIDVMCDERDELQAFLKDRKIGTRVMYPPINKQPAYNRPGSYPVSEAVGARGLWLPSANQLADAQIESVAAAINEFYF
jgi:perosamine synthetase